MHMSSFYTQDLNIKGIESLLRDRHKHTQQKNVLLLDGDRTLSHQDTGYMFGDLLGIKYQIKSIFESNGYSFDAFRKVQEIYGKLPLDVFNDRSAKVAREVTLYPGVVEFIKDCIPIAITIIVTSSLQEIWQNISSINELDIVVIGMNHPEVSFQVVGKEEKRFISYWFKSLGCRVVSLGDSELDVGMLSHADLPIIVVNHRSNRDLLPLLDRKLYMKQLSFSYPLHQDMANTSLVEILDYLRFQG